MELPQSVKVTLWSYDISKLDLTRDRARIITNVLNYGTLDATLWLKKTYTKVEIADVLSDAKPGEWSNRSLNLWSLVYDVPAVAHKRF